MTIRLLALLFALASYAQAQAPDGGVTFDSRLKNDVNGYVVEARVPWALVGVTPREGLVVGFDVHVNDDDEGGEARRQKLVWSGTPGDDQHEDPRAFGSVVLGFGRDGLTGLPAASGPLAVDGERESAWDAAAVLPLAHARLVEATPTAADLRATAYALWDAEALYLLVDVTDNRVVVDTDARVHLDDGVEVYLDGGHERAEHYDVNDLKLAFRPGRSDADLTSLALDAQYDGRAADAPWRRLARARIEALRKGPLRVVVEDADGRPVEGAEVHVAMQRHAFEFGAALDAWRLADPGPDGEHYRDFVARRFNGAVFENDFKHRPWQTAASESHPKFRRSYAADAVRWLNRADIDVRAHYVFWNPLNLVPPDSVEAARRTPEAVRQFWLDDIRRRVLEIDALGDIPEWDALNHPVGWSPLVTEIVGRDLLVDVMRLARDLLPGRTLYVNEGGVLTSQARVEGYDEDVRYLIEQGVAPDGIGFMGHFGHGAFSPPEEIYSLLDRFARLVPRLKLTEFDIDTADDSLQADYLRDVMTVAFSHPAVEGIVMWGFWEADHWRPQAALYREDWTPKPAGEAWERLVLDEWWTNETATTGDDGTAHFRAFLGDHGVTVRHGGREVRERVELGRDGETLTVRLGVGEHRGAR